MRFKGNLENLIHDIISRRLVVAEECFFSSIQEERRINVNHNLSQRHKIKMEKHLDSCLTNYEI